MSKTLLQMAAEIVQAQTSLNKMSPEEIEIALIGTFNALQKMQKAEEEGKSLSAERTLEGASAEKILDPNASIQESKIVCLECGAEMRQLTANHLSVHGLTPREYKRKYGFPLKQPLSAKSLTKARSKSAKKRGIPPELKAFQDDRKRQKQSMEESRFEEKIPDAVPLSEIVESPAFFGEEKTPAVKSKEKKEANKSKKSPKKKIAEVA